MKKNHPVLTYLPTSEQLLWAFIYARTSWLGSAQLQSLFLMSWLNFSKGFLNKLVNFLHPWQTMVSFYKAEIKEMYFLDIMFPVYSFGI